MFSELAIDVTMLVALFVALGIVGWFYWQQWRQENAPQRAEMVEGAVKRLVEAAEQMYSAPGQGKTKFGWVMGRLQRRFPQAEWEELSEHLEAAVLHLNASRAARVGHRNGSTPPDGP